MPADGDRVYRDQGHSLPDGGYIVSEFRHALSSRGNAMSGGNYSMPSLSVRHRIGTTATRRRAIAAERRDGQLRGQ